MPIQRLRPGSARSRVPDIGSSALDLGAELIGESGVAALDRGLQGLECFQLDRFGLAALLPGRLHFQDLFQRLGRKHFAAGAECFPIAPAAEGDGGVVPHVAVFVVVQAVTERGGVVLAPEKPERVDGHLANGRVAVSGSCR